jgi:hypothetical protein
MRKYSSSPGSGSGISVGCRKLYFSAISVSIVLLLIILSATSSLGQSPHLQTHTRSSVDNRPRIGAYRKNFRGDVSKVISETPNSVLTLPVLKYEDNTWEGYSIQLDCNAPYPVQWVYNGLGVCHFNFFIDRVECS